MLVRYQGSDASGFELFYRRNQALVFNYLLSKLGTRGDAEEAFQETFLRLHAAILSYDPKQSALVWLMTIARNVAFDALRKRRSGRAFMADEAAAGARYSEPRAEALALAKEALQGIVASLTDDERALLESRVLGDESYEEIAEKRQISPALARQKVSRLLKRLRER